MISGQSLSRTDPAEAQHRVFLLRVRPLSDGSNPWSTSLVKSQKSVPLAALFAEQGQLLKYCNTSNGPWLIFDKRRLGYIFPHFCLPASAGKDETASQESPDSSSKPKQLKFPNQVYIDLPLWRDEPQSPGGPGDGGVGAGGQGGQSEITDDPSTTTSTSSTSTTPQHTPTNSLKRTSARRKTDSALYGCGSLLASVVLGYDIREALKNSVTPGDDGEPPREEKEKKKKEGLFQRATRFRRSTSPPGGRSRKDEASSNHQGAAQPVNLISMSAIIECNSTKCLLQSEACLSDNGPRATGPIVLSRHTEPVRVASGACTEGRGSKTTTDATRTAKQTQSQMQEPSNHNTGTRLRRKKYHDSESSCVETNVAFLLGFFNTLPPVSSQWSDHSSRTEEAGQGQSTRQGLRRGGVVQTTTGVIQGQAPRLGPVERSQQELLAGPLLWRKDSTKPECGSVLGGLLPPGHGHRGPETGLHGATLPHSEFSCTTVCI